MTGLLFVHRVMITAAIAFCGVFFARELFVAARGDGGQLAITLAVVSAAAGVALAVYLRWWLRTKARALRDNSPQA
jgi:hypothetical protein